MNRVEGLLVGALLVVVAALTLVGRSDGGPPSVEAIAEAEQVAEAALLTVGDLPGDGWGVTDVGIEELQAAAPVRSNWPAECGEAPNMWWYEGATLAVRGTYFTILAPAGDTDSPRGSLTIMTMVLVFENTDQMGQALQETAAKAQAIYDDDDCTAALAAGRNSYPFQIHNEEPLYHLANDDTAVRSEMFNRATEQIDARTETHFIERGRVMAIYGVIESDDSPRQVDHQRLLEAFEARVVAAQE